MAGVFRALMPKSAGADSAEESVERRGSFFSALSERIDVELQMAGNLWKKDTAGSSSWNVRYFVIKDGFLLYYPEAKTPMMTFNMHPKVTPCECNHISYVHQYYVPTLCDFS
jgi:hypothetical protein